MIKVKNRKILLLPGDGIGPEVTEQVNNNREWFNENKQEYYFVDTGRRCFI